MEKKRYRLYIDESGSHNYTSSDKDSERYLCLMGVIISNEEYSAVIEPTWQSMRAIFTDDGCPPAVFHYVDVVAHKGCFGRLSDPQLRAKYNSSYLHLLNTAKFTLCSVVLDKKAHKARYTHPLHPYHYCLKLLLERYVMFLKDNSAVGDVIAEARGSKEDRLLQKEFSDFYECGNDFMPYSDVQSRLTTSTLKLATKVTYVCGIEMADMLAVPMKFLTLYSYNHKKSLSNNFTKVIIDTIKPRIRCSYMNEIKGYGIKLIP